MAWCETPPHLPVNLFAPSVSARPAPHKHPQLYSILCTPDAPHPFVCIHDLLTALPACMQIVVSGAIVSGTMISGTIRLSPAPSSSASLPPAPPTTASPAARHGIALGKGRGGPPGAAQRGAVVQACSLPFPRPAAAVFCRNIGAISGRSGTIWDDLVALFELCVSLTQG